jgi:hypothetical protein
LIVPTYWAEARLQHRERRRQVTVRRFGWSDISQDDAQTMADARAREAFDQVLAGNPLPRRERRIAYNGAEGVPIREEIVSRHGETIITRNSYGALCLNSPDVWFADIDFQEDLGLRSILVATLCVFLLTLILLLSAGWNMFSSVAVAALSGIALGYLVAHTLTKVTITLQGGNESIAPSRRPLRDRSS